MTLCLPVPPSTCIYGRHPAIHPSIRPSMHPSIHPLIHDLVSQSSGMDGLVHLYARGRDGYRLIDTLDYHEGSVTSVRFVGSSRLATCGSDGRVCVWDLPREQWTDVTLLSSECSEDDSTPFDLAPDPSGQYLLTGEGSVVLMAEMRRRQGHIKGLSAFIKDLRVS